MDLEVFEVTVFDFVSIFLHPTPWKAIKKDENQTLKSTEATVGTTKSKSNADEKITADAKALISKREQIKIEKQNSKTKN